MSGNESSSAPPPTSPSSGKSPVLLAILAVVAVVTVGGVVLVVALGALFWLNRAPGSSSVAQSPTSAAPVASPVAIQKVAIDGAPIDLLTKIELQKVPPRGQARLEKGELTLEGAKGLNHVTIPVTPPYSYEIEAHITPLAGKGVFIGLFVMGRPCLCTIDGFEGEPNGIATAVDTIDGCRPTAPAFPGAYRGQLMTAGKKSVILCSVMYNRVRISVDGQQVFEFAGDPARLGLVPVFAPADPQAIFVGSWDAQYRFSKLELRPLGEIPPDAPVATIPGGPSPPPGIPAAQPVGVASSSSEKPPAGVLTGAIISPMTREPYALREPLRDYTSGNVKWQDDRYVRQNPKTLDRSKFVEGGTSEFRRDLGDSLKADLLVFILPPQGENPAMHLIVSESKYGVILADEYSSIQSGPGPTAIIPLVQRALARVQAGPGELCTLIPFTKGADVSACDAWLPETITAIVEQQLVTGSRVGYVDLESATSVGEARLAARQSGLLELSGEINADKSSMSPKYRLQMRLKRAGKVLAERQDSLATLEEIPAHLAKTVDELLGKLGLRASDKAHDKSFDPAAFAERMYYRGINLLGNGNYPQARYCQEAATLAAPQSLEIRSQVLKTASQSCNLAELTRMSYVRGLEHAEKYLELGGKDYESTSVALPDSAMPRSAPPFQTPVEPGELKTMRVISRPLLPCDREIENLERQAIGFRMQNRAAGVPSHAEDAAREEAVLSRLVLRHIERNQDSTFYFQWLARGDTAAATLKRIAALAPQMKDAYQGGEHIRRWVEKMQGIHTIGRYGEVRSALAKAADGGNAGIKQAIKDIIAKFPKDDPESLAAKVQADAFPGSPQFPRVQVEIDKVKFSRWKRKDGRSAELAPLRVEGNIVEFCTRAGEIRELPLTDLADEEKVRLEEWRKAQMP